VRVLFLLFSSSLTLLSCARVTDSFAPQIVITKPASDTVTPRSNLTIEGYVWDDKGVMKLVLNGETDLLAKGPLAAQRGRKIVKFSFPADSLGGDKVRYELRAVDTGKRSSSREIRVTVDTKAPTLEIGNVDSQLENVAVSGVARDNQKVSQIAVNGEPLNVSPGAEVPFYTVVPRSRRRTIEFTVKDGVGNTSTKSIPVPAPPLPPPPPPAVTVAADGTVTPVQTPRRRSRRARTRVGVTSPPPAPPAVVAPIVPVRDPAPSDPPPR
jgi:hypothetical protein